MLRIVKATPKHCKRIVELAKEGELFNYTLLFYSLLLTLGWLYIAVDDEAVIGYVCFVVIPGARIAFNLQICIDKEHRSKNIGADLLSFMEKTLKEKHKVKTVYAHCLKPRVVKLLQRLKWEVILNILEVAFVQKELR